MARYFLVESNEFNITKGTERFASLDEFAARAVMSIIISSELDWDEAEKMTEESDSFIEGWKFPDMDAWVTLRRYDVADE